MGDLPRPRKIADTIKFQNLAKLLEKVTKVNGTGKDKIKPISSFFDHFRKAFKAEYGTLDSSQANGDSLYDIVRILLPSDDRLRPPYGLKGVKLSGIMAHAIGLDKNSEDGKKLINYKDPTKNTSATGDLGQIVYNILESRVSSSSRSGPTIQDLHLVLDEIAKAKEGGNEWSYVTKQKKVLRSFVPVLTPLEGKWLVRILLKNMHLGVGTSQIYKLIHPHAEELYNRTGNLEVVCQRLNDPNVEINLNEVELFQPFRPMLCTRLTKLSDADDDPTLAYGNKVGKKKVELPDPPFLLELKYDGERFQIHYDASRSPDDQFRFFSRRQFNYTHKFNSTLTPQLRGQIKSTCQSFILDGEMMAYHLETQSFTQKHPNIDVKNFNTSNKKHKPAFVAFDIVYFNGQSLITSPLEERIKILSKDKLVLEPKETVVYISEQKRIETKEEVMSALNDAIDALEEGLVVKELKSTYRVGGRDPAWLKIKPEFFNDTAISDMDLLILGGYYSDTRQTVRGMSYLVGLIDKKPGEKEVFYPVSEVGAGGLRNPELYKLIKKLRPNFLRKENPDFNILFKGKKKPDFFIDPKNSHVLQVKATQILRNGSYALGYTLGFPRISQDRPDKSWQDIMTLDEFQCLIESTGGKLAKRSDATSPNTGIAKKVILSKYIKPTRESNKESDNEGDVGDADDTRIDDSSDDDELAHTSRSTRSTTNKYKKFQSSNINSTTTTPTAISAPSRQFTIAKGYKSIRGGIKLDESSPPSVSSTNTSPQSTSSSTTTSPARRVLLPLKSPVKKVLTDVFDSHVFYVCGGLDWKNRVETEILEHGGLIVQNPSTHTFACIAEKMSVRVDALAKKGVHDILKYSWVEKSIEMGRMKEITPEDLWSAGAATKQKLAKDYDEFGDSYTKKSTSLEVKKLLNEIAEKLEKEDNKKAVQAKKLLTKSQQEEQNLKFLSDFMDKSKRVWDEEDFDESDVRKLKKYDFLNGRKILFHGGESSPSSSSLAELEELKLKVQFYGGQVALEEDDDNLSHIVILNSNYVVSNDDASKGALIVTLQWLRDCFEKKRLLDEQLYLVSANH